MVPLTELWLPIVLSGAAVWIASAVAWMMMPHHKGEYKPIPNEDAFLAAVRSVNLPIGQYMFPHWGDQGNMNDPELKAKMKAGPMGTINVFAGWGNMGAKMLLSIAFYMIVSVMVAIVAATTLHKGEDHHQVFHLTALVAAMSYGLGSIPRDLCFNAPPRAIAAGLIDGIVFGLITGAIFTWRWPGM